ncbi:DDE-domain-containing protein [Tricholoma matsutake]|nr:DDE-domain-containing protein [Tricholoma matsutake 945]
MPLEPTSPSTNIISLPQEDQIQLAINAITQAEYKANGDQQLSTQKAADTYLVPHTTLCSHMKGLHTHAEAHVEQQNLSTAEEEVLVKWAKVQGHWGIPLTYSTLTKYASEISGKLIGESWPKQFLAKHPDLKVKATMSLEKCQAKTLNQTAVDGFYDVLEAVVEEFHIKQEHMWNMDKKGVQLGIGAKVAVIIDSDQATVYSVEDGNHELVTIIEAVCADGTSLIPLVIFQGARQNLEWGRPENNPSSASVSVSLKGWTNQELGLKWLEWDFEPNMRPEAPEEYCLLILDRHNSHCTYPFIKFSAEHHIIIICLPSHTTHALQPCDVGVFGPLAHA